MLYVCLLSKYKTKLTWGMMIIINITSYIQAFLTVSHYHKVYIHAIVFISDLETDHS